MNKVLNFIQSVTNANVISKHAHWSVDLAAAMGWVVSGQLNVTHVLMYSVLTPRQHGTINREL